MLIVDNYSHYMNQKKNKLYHLILVIASHNFRFLDASFAICLIQIREKGEIFSNFNESNF